MSKNSKEAVQSKSVKTKGLVGRDSSKQASSMKVTSNPGSRMSNVKSTTSNLKPTTLNPKLATSNLKYTTRSNLKPTTSKPTTSNPKPSTSNPKPSTSNPRTTTSKPLHRKMKTFPKNTEIPKHNCINKAPKKVLIQTPKSLGPPKQRNMKKTPAYMDQSLPLRERLELWRKEKRKTMPAKFLKTPSTLRKGTKPKIENKEPTVPKNVKPDTSQLSETVDGNMNEKDTTMEEIHTENTAIPEESKQEVRKKLQECLLQLKEDDYSLDEVSCQLDEIQKEHPDAIQSAEFWICRAKIAECNGDHGRVVCLFEQATAFSAEPASLIDGEFSAYSARRNVVEEQTKDTCDEDKTSLEDKFNQSHNITMPSKDPVTPHRVGCTAEISSPSSIIRYSVTKATPYRSRLRTCERPTVTPVRRSVRLERRSVNYPIMLQEHGLTVRHLDELPQDIKEEVSFRPNFAVESELNNAWKEIMEC